MFNDLKLQIKTRIIGKKVLYAEEIDSTNDEAKKLALVDPSEGIVVIADTQKKGKGRLGRHWSSQKGKGIAVSVIIRPYANISRLPVITYFSSIAAVRSIRGLTGLDAKIKWPNDIMISGKKAGGILTEVVDSPKYGKAVVIGIGLNVNDSIKAFPASIRRRATSIKFELGSSVDTRKLLNILLEEFDRLYRSFLQRHYSDIIEEWVVNSQTMGEWVTVNVGLPMPTGRQASGRAAAREVEGLAESVGPMGELNIRTPNGRIKKIYSGDVIKVTEGYLRRRTSR